MLIVFPDRLSSLVTDCYICKENKNDKKIYLFLLGNVLNDRLYKRFCELSRLATNIECIDQLMDLLRMQNSMDEILSLISQATSPQVHARIAELIHTLLNVRKFF
jgi:hypothetical protein